MYRGIFAFIYTEKCPESATEVRQIQEKLVLCDSVRPCSVCYIIRLYCGLLYAPAMGWVCSVSRPTYLFPHLWGERYLIPTLYTRVSVRLTTPTQKSASIDTSGNGVNLPDCTDLCNRLKIERVSMPSKLSVFQLRPFAWSA